MKITVRKTANANTTQMRLMLPSLLNFVTTQRILMPESGAVLKDIGILTDKHTCNMRKEEGEKHI